MEVIKPVSQLDNQEYCDCGTEMRRTIAFKGGVSTDDRYKGYNPAFGKFIKNKADLKNTLAEIKGETGKDLIEVGNESPRVKKAPSKFDEETVKAAYNELKGKWPT